MHLQSIGGLQRPDVRVGEWSMRWNARDGVGRLGPGIPKSDFWASAKEGIDLLTRGLRGCYVYFMGAPTRDFFLSRTESLERRVARAAEGSIDYK